uniref:Putative reverse transcriptase domain-containing protein n=1 Tax=Tanacetum cinerariifolium TaxID=118510 RepID=A0A6L2JKX1_TANCI|nr:putative reverse transcriptase domain-containing protein [Tanacetum cinerariifolium]
MPPRRSKGEELKYPFLKGDGSSFDEWRDYGVASDDYEGPSMFDDDKFKDELEIGDDDFVLIGKEVAPIAKFPRLRLPYHGDSSDDDLVGNSRTNFVYPWGNSEGPKIHTDLFSIKVNYGDSFTPKGGREYILGFLDPASSLSSEDVTTMKSASTFPLTELRPLNLMLFLPNSMAHIINNVTCFLTIPPYSGRIFKSIGEEPSEGGGSTLSIGKIAQRLATIQAIVWLRIQEGDYLLRCLKADGLSMRRSTLIVEDDHSHLSLGGLREVGEERLRILQPFLFVFELVEILFKGPKSFLSTDSRTPKLASTKAKLITRLGLAEVEAWLAGGVFLGVLTVKVESVMGGSSPTLGLELTTKGLGLRVADSHTGNHRENDFMLLETIRRILGISSELERNLLLIIPRNLLEGISSELERNLLLIIPRNLQIVSSGIKSSLRCLPIREFATRRTTPLEVPPSMGLW